MTRQSYSSCRDRSVLPASFECLIARISRFMARQGGVIPLEPRPRASEDCLNARYQEIIEALRSLGYNDYPAFDGAGAAFVLGKSLLYHDQFCHLSPEQRAILLWETALETARAHNLRMSRHFRLASNPKAPSSGEDSLTEWVAQGLRAQLAVLTDRQRTVVELRFYEELTLAEIGEVLGISLQSVHARLEAALRRLKAACQ